MMGPRGNEPSDRMFGKVRIAFQKYAQGVVNEEDIKGPRSYIMRKPITAYGIALDLLRTPDRHLPESFVERMKEIARSAARESLRNDELGNWTTQMRVRPDDYIRFTSYYSRCKTRLLEFLTTDAVIEAMGSWWVWYKTRCGRCTLVVKGVVVPRTSPGVAEWWVKYWKKVLIMVEEYGPSPEPFEVRSVWQSTLSNLEWACPACHKAAAEEFPLFKENMELRIRRVIDSVGTPFVDSLDCRKPNCNIMITGRPGGN